nr:serine/threonine-protein kinase [Actinomyces trachealis]
MTTSATSPASAPLRRLGSAYVLLDRIGSGAQGEVWRAQRAENTSGSWDPVGTDTSAPGVHEELAAKVLSADIVSQPGVLERFLAERATLMRIRSQSVVAVRDLVVEGNTFAILMDLVDGGDLRGHLLQHGVLPPAEVARVGALIAEGLAAVHAVGVLHRDIKPANVLLERHAEGEPVVPRLADFGVARICEAVGATTSTSAIGTPLYMAPEVLTGKVPPLTADVYSLGVMLYEMTCGVPPFKGSTPQVLASHARHTPGRPDGVPDVLWELILSMQSKQAADRPSAAAVAERLRLLEPSLRGLPAAPRLSTPPPATRAHNPFEWDPQEPAASKAGTVQEATLVEQSGAVPASAAGYGIYGSPPAATSGGSPQMVSSSSPAYGVGQSGGAGTGQGTVPLPGSSATSVLPPAGAGGSAPAAVPYGATPASFSAVSLTPAAAPPRRSRTGLVAALVAVLALTGTGIGGYWLYNRWGSSDAANAISGLPLQAKLQESQRIADVSKIRLSPNKRVLASEHFGNWSLRDLDSDDQAAFWTGNCWGGYFFTNEVFVCQHGIGEQRKFIGLDGQPKSLELSKGTEVLGTTGELAIVREGSYEGSLVALDSSGNQVWRLDGGYTKAQVTKDFVLTYENGSKRIQVLKATNGAIRLSQPVEKTPEWDKPRPGGVDILVGGQGFLVEGSPSVVYDAEGNSLGEVAADNGLPTSWQVQDPTSAADLKKALNAMPQDSGRYARALLVSGGDSLALSLDTNTCAANVLGKEGLSFAAPQRTEGEACTIYPVGIIDNGAGVVFGMGEHSSKQGATGDQVVAYNRKTGEQVWQVKGNLVTVLSQHPSASGTAAKSPRLMVREGGSSGDLVLYTVVANRDR